MLFSLRRVDRREDKMHGGDFCYPFYDGMAASNGGAGGSGGGRWGVGGGVNYSVRCVSNPLP